jgi:hypothetical protein
MAVVTAVVLHRRLLRPGAEGRPGGRFLPALRGCMSACLRWPRAAAWAPSQQVPLPEFCMQLPAVVQRGMRKGTHSQCQHAARQHTTHLRSCLLWRVYGNLPCCGLLRPRWRERMRRSARCLQQPQESLFVTLQRPDLPLQLHLPQRCRLQLQLPAQHRYLFRWAGLLSHNPVYIVIVCITPCLRQPG